MNVEVLNVDDDKMVLFIHQKMMVNAQFCDSPKSFEDGYVSLAYIEKEKNNDKHFIIFLDVNMPKLDGWAFLDLLENKGLSSYCYVFVITSSIDHSDQDKAKAYAAVIGFVEKPLSIEKLKNLNTADQLKPFFD